MDPRDEGVVKELAPRLIGRAESSSPPPFFASVSMAKEEKYVPAAMSVNWPSRRSALIDMEIIRTGIV